MLEETQDDVIHGIAVWPLVLGAAGFVAFAIAWRALHEHAARRTPQAALGWGALTIFSSGATLLLPAIALVAAGLSRLFGSSRGAPEKLFAGFLQAEVATSFLGSLVLAAAIAAFAREREERGAHAVLQARRLLAGAWCVTQVPLLAATLAIGTGIPPTLALDGPPAAFHGRTATFRAKETKRGGAWYVPDVRLRSLPAGTTRIELTAWSLVTRVRKPIDIEVADELGDDAFPLRVGTSVWLAQSSSSDGGLLFGLVGGGGTQGGPEWELHVTRERLHHDGALRSFDVELRSPHGAGTPVAVVALGGTMRALDGAKLVPLVQETSADPPFAIEGARACTFGILPYAKCACVTPRRPMPAVRACRFEESSTGGRIAQVFSIALTAGLVMTPANTTRTLVTQRTELGPPGAPEPPLR